MNLNKNFTYHFSKINIFNILKLVTDSELELNTFQNRKGFLKKRINKNKELLKKQEEIKELHTPRFKKEIQNAISILDEEIHKSDKNSLKELSIEIKDLDDEIKKILSDIPIDSPVQFLKSRKNKKTKKK